MSTPTHLNINPGITINTTPKTPDGPQLEGQWSVYVEGCAQLAGKTFCFCLQDKCTAGPKQYMSPKGTPDAFTIVPAFDGSSPLPLDTLTSLTYATNESTLQPLKLDGCDKQALNALQDYHITLDVEYDPTRVDPTTGLEASLQVFRCTATPTIK